MRNLMVFIVLILVSCQEDGRKLDVTSQSEIHPNGSQLEVVDFNGLQKYLSTQDDQIIVVNFWATWCAPCIKELPYFERLNAEYADKKVKVILVSLDFPNKYDSQLKPFIREHDIRSKVIALNDTDSNSWIPKVHKDWSGAIPATLIFNKDQRQFHEQSFTYLQLENEVKPFLN